VDQVSLFGEVEFKKQAFGTEHPIPSQRFFSVSELDCAKIKRSIDSDQNYDRGMGHFKDNYCLFKPCGRTRLK